MQTNGSFVCLSMFSINTRNLTKLECGLLFLEDENYLLFLNYLVSCMFVQTMELKAAILMMESIKWLIVSIIEVYVLELEEYWKLSMTSTLLYGTVLKTQTAVDRRFRQVPGSFYCSKQRQPHGTGPEVEF